MASEFRYSDEEFEYRADDNGLGTVTGVIVRYGDVAQLSPHVLTEQIERGAFHRWATHGGSTGCTRGQGRSLGPPGTISTLVDAADALRFRLSVGSTANAAGERDTGYELAHGHGYGGRVLSLGQ